MMVYAFERWLTDEEKMERERMYLEDTNEKCVSSAFRMFAVDRQRLFIELVVMHRELVKMAREDVDWDKLQLQSERERIRSQIVSWAIAKSEARAKVMSKTRPEAMPDLVSGARAKAYASACEDMSRSRSRTDSSIQ